MSVLTKFLRVGEGKKLRALQSLVPDINALEPEMRSPFGRGAGSQDGGVQGAASPTARTSTSS